MLKCARTRGREAILAALVALGTTAPPTLAQVNFSFGIEIAPPLPPVYVAPSPRPGFVWAPGYWAWDGRSYLWVEGHWMKARPGYYWVPDGWEHHVEERGEHWHYAPGHWKREHGHWERDRGHGHQEGEHHDER